MSGTAAVPEEERLARVALGAVTEPADPRVARLVSVLGPVEVYERLRADTGLDGLRSEVAERLAGLRPAQVLDRAAAAGARFVVPGDAEWPPGFDDLGTVEALNGMAGAPLGVWVRGPVRLDEACRAAVAVVGSRSATTYGTQVAGRIVERLSEERVTVVSGAAFGIDQAAHRAALGQRGPTVAVLACGVDRAYPAAHQGLLDHIAEVGAVVSELRPGCAPTRIRFLSRNRLIAAMTGGTVVVEAAVRSGALNTASWAGRLNRPLMGVPGPVTSAPSEGVHELIRSGAATLVTRGEHVLELVGRLGTDLAPAPRGTVTAFDLLDPLEQRVLEAVPLRAAVPAEAIARTAGLATRTVHAALVRLADLGRVRHADGRWCRGGVGGGG